MNFFSPPYWVRKNRMALKAVMALIALIEKNTMFDDVMSYRALKSVLDTCKDNKVKKILQTSIVVPTPSGVFLKDDNGRIHYSITVMMEDALTSEDKDIRNRAMQTFESNCQVIRLKIMGKYKI